MHICFCHERTFSYSAAYLGTSRSKSRSQVKFQSSKLWAGKHDHKVGVVQVKVSWRGYSTFTYLEASALSWATVRDLVFAPSYVKGNNHFKKISVLLCICSKLRHVQEGFTAVHMRVSNFQVWSSNFLKSYKYSSGYLTSFFTFTLSDISKLQLHQISLVLRAYF